MGCDIHFVVERKTESGWLGLFERYQCQGLARDRNYGLFAELASVRGRSSQGREPKGLPDDASELARYHVTRWGSDGHSHSHLSMREFCEAAATVDAAGVKKGAPIFARDFERRNPAYALFNIDLDDTERDHFDDYRVVFWFDN